MSWYYRGKSQEAEKAAAAHRAGMEVLRATVRTERAARREAETARNKALAERMRARLEAVPENPSAEDADAGWAAAAARVRND